MKPLRMVALLLTFILGMAAGVALMLGMRPASMSSVDPIEVRNPAEPAARNDKQENRKQENREKDGDD